jgi:hypothetical protein
MNPDENVEDPARKETQEFDPALVDGVPTASGQKTTLSQYGIGLSQRAKAEFELAQAVEENCHHDFDGVNFTQR